MPRVITVDPTGAIARIVRSAMDLLDLSITQVDVPSTSEALEELNRKANLVVTAFELDDMKGFEFALRIKQTSEETSVIILGDVDDPSDLDDETAQNSPFVYMSRPVDIHQFLRVLVAGMESHEAMVEALRVPSNGAASAADMGPVPSLDMEAATKLIDRLMMDLGAMAIIFASRAGEILVERGTVNQIDRDALAASLAPILATNIGVKDLVGGNVSTIQLYDGDNYDVFVLSVGLHHFMCIMFDGQKGSKQLGMVLSLGRRAVEDLIALVGASAFFISPPTSSQKEDAVRRSQTVRKAKPAEQDEPIVLAPAELEDDNTEEEEAEPEPVMEQLEPIGDLDLDELFGEDMSVDESMFDLDKVEEIAKSNQQNDKSALDWDQAQQLGILKK